jgi:hypothetical protein
MVEFLLVALILLAIPIVLPIVAWVSTRRTRTELETLVRVVESQEKEIDDLRARVAALGSAPPPSAAQTAATTPVRPQPVSPAVPVAPAAPVPPPVAVPVPPAVPRTIPEPRVVERPLGEPPRTPPASPARPPAVPPVPPPVAAPPAQAAQPARPPTPPVAPPVPPPPPPPASRPAAPAFDWESLVGVKLFSAFAGVAMVIGAVLFLRYSVEAGWLQPPVRVAIGILVAIALLVVCEMKAARRYPVTANAMDAAAIAILFATFFAAHALWNLIPALVAFALLAVVTALHWLLLPGGRRLWLERWRPGLLRGLRTHAAPW